MDSEYEAELQARLAVLREEHGDMDQVVSKLMTTPPVDFIQLQRLKKKTRPKGRDSKVRERVNTRYYCLIAFINNYATLSSLLNL